MKNKNKTNKNDEKTNTKEAKPISPEEAKEIEKGITYAQFKDIAEEKARLHQERITYMKTFGLRHLQHPDHYKPGQKKWNDIFLTVAKAFAALGVSETDMAYLLEVHPKTFTNWYRRHPELKTKIKEGIAIRNLGLLQDLQNSSHRGSFAVQIFLAKNWLGMTDRIDTAHSGEVKVVYRSNIPKDSAKPDPDSIKKPKKKFT